MNREQWLEQRRKGIGSSEAAAVCGQSPWSNPFMVYCDKVGDLAEQAPSAAMTWGLRLEPVIAAAYTEETGRDVAMPGLQWHPRYPWMLASIDRLADDGRIVELKTSSAFADDEWGSPGTDEIPDAYNLQVQHQMAVTDVALADVAVLIGGSDFRIYTVPRCPRAIDRLIEIEEAFWQRVVSRRPPDPDWRHPATARLMEALYDVEESATIVLGQEAMAAAALYQEHKEQEAIHKECRHGAKAQLLYLMGEAGIGYLPNGQAIVRKRIQRRGYTVEPTTYIDFRIKSPKGARS